MQAERSNLVRNSAEVLLRNQYLSQSYGSIQNFSSSSSYSSYSYCPQVCKISHARRTFCLIATFDFLLSFLLWLMFVKLKGGDFGDGLVKEFTDYHFQTSLMDYLVAAISRFVILVLSYGLLRLGYPYAVAVTTLLTCVYIVLKICFFQSPSALFFVMMGVSFVISWVETWFIDFRVLPSESSEILDIGGIVNIERSGNDSSINEQDGFLTPTEESDDEEDCQIDSKDAEYYKKGRDIWKSAFELFEKNHGWKKETSNGGIVVYSQHFKTYGRIFKAEAKIQASVDDVFRETTLSCERIPLWNKCVEESKVIKKINSSTDIAYHVTKKTNGVINSRDFVSVRHWKKTKHDGSILSVSSSVDFPSFPHKKAHVRGETKIAAWMFESLPDNCCNLKMLIASDIKGWIPQSVIDQALSGVIVDTIRYLRLHMTSIKN